MRGPVVPKRLNWLIKIIPNHLKQTTFCSKKNIFWLVIIVEGSKGSFVGQRWIHNDVYFNSKHNNLCHEITEDLNKIQRGNSSSDKIEHCKSLTNKEIVLASHLPLSPRSISQNWRTLTKHKSNLVILPLRCWNSSYLIALNLLYCNLNTL